MTTKLKERELRQQQLDGIEETYQVARAYAEAQYQDAVGQADRDYMSALTRAGLDLKRVQAEAQAVHQVAVQGAKKLCDEAKVKANKALVRAMAKAKVERKKALATVGKFDKTFGGD